MYFNAFNTISLKTDWLERCSSHADLIELLLDGGQVLLLVLVILQQGLVLLAQVGVHGGVVVRPTAVCQVADPDQKVALVRLQSSPLVLDPTVFLRKELFLHPLLVELHLELPQLAVFLLDLSRVFGDLPGEGAVQKLLERTPIAAEDHRRPDRWFGHPRDCGGPLSHSVPGKQHNREF